MIPTLSRRRFAAGILASLGATGPVAEAAASKGKKGWAGGDPELHAKFKVHWHYTWTPAQSASKTIEFVPMVKGAGSVDKLAALSQLPDIKHLLGFNEPERADQGNVSVADALDLWPKLEAVAEAHKLRLGSPATSSDQGGMKWFEAFMRQAKQRKLRIDFVSLHWYRGRNAGAFESFVKEMARGHRLPVWITEFNGWSGSEAENFNFLQRCLQFLEKAPEVERYAYFNPQSDKPHTLVKADGSLTRMGNLYRDA